MSKANEYGFPHISDFFFGAYVGGHCRGGASAWGGADWAQGAHAVGEKRMQRDVATKRPAGVPAVPEAKRSESTPPRQRYEAPKVTKKRSVARVTLFSAGGTSSTGFTLSG